MTIDKNIFTYEEQAVFTLRSLYGSHGYDRYKMSRFEEYDLYVRNKDFLVSDEVIAFTDRSGRLMALKPDVTLSIIKNTVDAPGVVQKLYYNENVYRVPEGSNSFKEIMQVGLECVGDLTPKDIAEVVLLAAKSLELLSARFVLDISHMGFVSAVLEACGFSAGSKKAAIKYMNQKNSHELQLLCNAEGADYDKISKILDCVGQPDLVLPRLRDVLTTKDEMDSYLELCRICQMLQTMGLNSNVQIDFSVGNNLKYYSGIVFRGYIDGVPTGILSGGQYDALLQKMGRSSKAVGFAIYVDQLQETVIPVVNFADMEVGFSEDNG